MLKMPLSSTVYQEVVSGDSKGTFILNLCNELVIHKHHTQRIQMKSLTFIGRASYSLAYYSICIH